MKTIRTRALALLGALALWCAGVVGAAGASAAGIAADGQTPPPGGQGGPADPALQQVVSDSEPMDLQSAVVLDHGHIDIGPRLLDGKWQLMARDDTATPSVWRPLDKIVFKVGDAAIMPLPDDPAYAFTGAKPGQKVHVIPQSEIPKVPWLGWSTQSPAVVNGIDGQMQLIFDGHEGAGQFTNFYQAGNFGGPQQNFTSATPTAQVLNVDANTHVHTNWIFTKPGVHLVRLTAKATLKGGQQVQDSQVLRFAVGDGTDPAAAAAKQWQAPSHPQAHPADDAKVTGDTPASSRATVMWVGIGLLVCGVIAAVIAAAVLRRASAGKRAARKQVVDGVDEGDSGALVDDDGQAASK